MDRLIPADVISPTWLRLKDHIEQRIRDLREQNDHPLPEARTADIRGRIAELKALLALEVQPKEP